MLEGLKIEQHRRQLAVFGEWDPAGVVGENLDADVIAAGVEVGAHTLAGLVRPDYTDMLPRVTVPTLIAPGDGDTLRPVSVHEEMAARIPNSRLAVIHNSGHMVAMEQPEQVTGALREWLSL